jgi:Predicted xylanase/chitin deacetylase
MKRIITVLLIFSSVFLFAACKEKPDKSESSDGTLPTNETQENVPIDTLSNTKIGWGLGKSRDENNVPTDAIKAAEKYGKYGAIFLGGAPQKVYLTFDQGYEIGYTAKILDVLKEKHVPAVFFCTFDYVRDEPELVRRMIDEGHVIGNHTMNHPSMPDVSPEVCVKEITDLHNIVLENFGETMTLFRPPMGEFSEKTLAITKNCGYKNIFWSFAYADWDTEKQPEPEPSKEKVINAAHPGAIYLLHGVSATNAEILSDVIDGIRAKGFEFDLIK